MIVVSSAFDVEITPKATAEEGLLCSVEISLRVRGGVRGGARVSDV